MPKYKTIYGTNVYNPAMGVVLEKDTIDLEKFPHYKEHEDGSITGIGIFRSGEWFSSFSAAKKYYMERMQSDLNNLRYQIKLFRGLKKDDVTH